ncbi:MAG: phosphoglycerate dehydrogenase [Phycisphaerales bacterium]
MSTSFPKEKIRVVLLESIHEAGREALAREGFSVTAHDKALEGPALRRAIGEAHILGIRSKTQVRSEALAAAPRLWAVGCFCIGTNQVDLPDARRRGVAVFNSPFSNTRSVAELTIAEIIALHRRLGDQSARMHRGEWDKSAAGAHEVRGRTLGIVGYGHIGSQVSVLAEALGMRVVFFDIISKLPLGNARACRSMDELLKQSDVVTLHVPATERTEGPPPLIGRAQLRAMKRGAMLINNARGGVVDVPALASALRDEHLGGAALDVFPHEPAGKGDRFESELCGLANVLLTPHVGGSTEEAQESIALDVAGKLVRFMNNGSTAGSVNLPEVDLPEQREVDGESGGAGARRRSHRILHLHRNVPGVLQAVNTRIAELGVNVEGQYLRTREDVGYAVIDVGPGQGKAILAGLREMPETIRVRGLW